MKDRVEEENRGAKNVRGAAVGTKRGAAKGAAVLRAAYRTSVSHAGAEEMSAAAAVVDVTGPCEPGAGRGGPKPGRICAGVSVERNPSAGFAAAATKKSAGPEPMRIVPACEVIVARRVGFSCERGSM